MQELRYAASLRASVNRWGNWYNFNYWHGLGDGARHEAVARTQKQLSNLRAVISNLLGDTDLSHAHGFLGHLTSQVDEAANEFYRGVQAVGEAAFREQLRGDHGDWEQCRERWGGGPGYKLDIRKRTNDWFSQEQQEQRLERRRFIEAELQRRWQELVERVRSQVETAKPAGAVIGRVFPLLST